jgi:four helix bundle protein
MTDTSIRDFRDLVVWQQAMELALACDRIADQLPRNSSKLASQIRRAANSVHANIAEGNGSFSLGDYLRRLSKSNGSLRELESHLIFVARKHPEIGVKEAQTLTVRVAMLLAGLVRSLRLKREQE